MPFKIDKLPLSDVDNVTNVIEQGLTIPWVGDPIASWAYYDCAISAMLDSGIAVHNQLPQVDNLPDTLASCFVRDPKLESIIIGGVNLTSRDQYQDIVQRMGHSRYWFRFYGEALRFGYKIPIPGIQTIGGVPAIPYDLNPQWAFCKITPLGNYSGVPLWHAQWSLWYTTAIPPVNNDIPAIDLVAHISHKTVLPNALQPPYSAPDDSGTNKPIVDQKKVQ